MGSRRRAPPPPLSEQDQAHVDSQQAIGDWLSNVAKEIGEELSAAGKSGVIGADEVVCALVGLIFMRKAGFGICGRLWLGWPQVKLSKDVLSAALRFSSGPQDDLGTCMRAAMAEAEAAKRGTMILKALRG